MCMCWSVHICMYSIHVFQSIASFSLAGDFFSYLTINNARICLTLWNVWTSIQSTTSPCERTCSIQRWTCAFFQVKILHNTQVLLLPRSPSENSSNSELTLRKWNDKSTRPYEAFLVACYNSNDENNQVNIITIASPKKCKAMPLPASRVSMLANRKRNISLHAQRWFTGSKSGESMCECVCCYMVFSNNNESNINTMQSLAPTQSIL